MLSFPGAYRPPAPRIKSVPFKTELLCLLLCMSGSALRLYPPSDSSTLYTRGKPHGQGWGTRPGGHAEPGVGHGVGNPTTGLSRLSSAVTPVRPQVSLYSSLVLGGFAPFCLALTVCSFSQRWVTSALPCREVRFYRPWHGSYA